MAAGTEIGRMVHVGAVDAPVTLPDVKAIARETWKAASAGNAKKAAADILGWEFAFELNETADRSPPNPGLMLSFKKIPREVWRKRLSSRATKFLNSARCPLTRSRRGGEVTSS